MALMNQLVWVGLGGAIGASGRHLASLMAARWLGSGFPYGTLAVNWIGCFVIGAAMGGMLGGEGTAGKTLLTEDARLFLVVGMLGGFTTFSSFGLEGVQLLKAGRFGLAGVHLLSHLLGGYLAVWAGWRLVQG
jgi:CrcB protein